MKRSTNLIMTIALALVFASCEKEHSIKEEGNLVPKTVEFDASLPAVLVNGTKLHAEAFGNPTDPMLVVIHGGPGSDYRHLLNCKAFADNGYYVVFYDQRGSGLSKRESKDSYNLQVMYDDLTGIINHYRTYPTQKIFLLGHSWGGILAGGYMGQYPTAITGAIVAEPGGYVWQDIVDYIARLREYPITSEALNDVTFADQFLTGNEDEHAILDYKMGLMVAAEREPDSKIGNDGPVIFWRHGAIVNQAMFEIGDREKTDFRGSLYMYTTKVMFMYSERNKAYGYDHAIRVSSAFPNVQIERVDGAGHDMISFPTGFSNFFPKALNYLNSL